MAPLCEPLDGFWLPRSLRDSLGEMTWECHSGAAGQSAAADEGVAVRWPKLSGEQWERLLDALQKAREAAMPDLLDRWQRALKRVPAILMGEPSRLQAIAEYTGYPVAMLLAAFGQGDLVRLDALMASFA
ncbi:MAG: hypothetical protein GX601_04650, partial [Anaerolineales bacterium]|nr:hypothetical protein [Anaerolineales bacterium]